MIPFFTVCCPVLRSSPESMAHVLNLNHHGALVFQFWVPNFNPQAYSPFGVSAERVESGLPDAVHPETVPFPHALDGPAFDKLRRRQVVDRRAFAAWFGDHQYRHRNVVGGGV